MNKYIISGTVSVRFEKVVYAENYEEAEDEQYDIESSIQTEWNGNSVFTDDPDLTLEVDGEVCNIEVELVEGEEPDEDDEED